MSEPTEGWSAPGAGHGPTGEQPAAPRQPADPGQPAAPGQPADPSQPAGPGGYGSPAGPGGYAGYPAWQTSPVWGAPRPPEVKPGVVPLRPLGLGELLDGAVAVVRGYPKPALGASALVALVTTAVTLLGTLPFLRRLSNLSPEQLEGPGALSELGDLFAGAAAGLSLTLVVSGLGSVVLTGCIAALCGRAVLGQPMSIGQLWQQLRPRLGTLLITGAVAVLLPFLPLLLAIGATAAASLLPGGALIGLLLVPLGIVLSVWLYIRFSLATSVVVLEQAGVRTALRRSAVLVRGSWWRVLGVLLLTAVIAGIISSVLAAPFSFIGGGNPFTGGTDATTLQLVAQQIGGGIASLIVGPFSAGVAALLYIDRRMRAEGLDVALAAAAAAPATQPQP